MLAINDYLWHSPTSMTNNRVYDGNIVINGLITLGGFHD
jgi:hypothetical protein